MQHLPDFPPLPKCFSHLVINTDGESRNIRVNLSQFNDCVTAPVPRFSSRPDGLTKADEFDDFDHYIMNGTCSNSLCVHKDIHIDDRLGQTTKSSSMKEPIQQGAVPVFESSTHDVSDQRSPFLKLQSSLLKLQREMVSF